MSAGGVDISFTADEMDLVKAQAKLIKQQEELIEKYKKVGKEAKAGGKEAEKAAAAAAKEVDRFAAATMRVNQTPVERYKEQMFKLNAALKAGKIDQESFTRATAAAKMQLDQVAHAGKSAFGPSALQSISGYVTGMLSLAGVAAGIFQTFSAAMQIADDMAAKQRDSMVGVGPLAQLAMGDKDRMRELIASTRASYAQGAGLSMAEAGKLQFEIASQNYEQYRQQIAELKASGAVPDPIGLVVGAAALETNLGPAAGGFPRITSMLMGAAGKSPGEIPDIAKASAEAAGTGVFLGLSPQEIMAASAVAAKASGSPEEGGMLMKNFFKGIEKDGLGKGGLKKRSTLLEYMQDIAALEAQGKKDYEIIGEDLRTYTGYRKLKAGLGIYRETLGEVDTAAAKNLFGSTMEMWKVSPEMIGARAQRQSEAGKELGFDREGVFANLAQAIRADMMNDTRQRRNEFFWKTPLRELVMDKAYAAEQWLNSPEEFVKYRGGQASAQTQEMIRLTYEALKASAEDQRQAAAALRDAAAQHNTNRQRAAAAVQPE